MKGVMTMRADIYSILAVICVFVYLMVLLWNKLLEAMLWEQTGKDFPERELFGRDWFDEEE